MKISLKFVLKGHLKMGKHDHADVGILLNDGSADPGHWQNYIKATMRRHNHFFVPLRARPQMCLTYIMYIIVHVVVALLWMKIILMWSMLSSEVS